MTEQEYEQLKNEFIDTITDQEASDEQIKNVIDKAKAQGFDINYTDPKNNVGYGEPINYLKANNKNEALAHMLNKGEDQNSVMYNNSSDIDSEFPVSAPNSGGEDSQSSVNTTSYPHVIKPDGMRGIRCPDIGDHMPSIGGVGVGSALEPEPMPGTEYRVVRALARVPSSAPENDSAQGKAPDFTCNDGGDA